MHSIVNLQYVLIILQCVYSVFTIVYSVYTVKFYSVATVILQWLYSDAAPPTVNSL